MNEPSNTTALPTAWIERLFARLLTLYGRKFADQWGCVDATDLKAAWARDLADMQPERIAMGLEACKSRPFPPTLPEFRALCGHGIAGTEAAFTEAARRWPSHEGWSESAIYWAAAAIGNDVRRCTWREIQGRWTFELERARRERKPVPDPVPESRHLEAPIDRETADQARDRVMASWRATQANRQPGDDDEIAA